jgi:hypothetical protein
MALISPVEMPDEDKLETLRRLALCDCARFAQQLRDLMGEI